MTGQILLRPRRIATEAVAAYDLAAPRLRLIADGWNTTFRVDTADGDRHLLRVHRAAVPDVGRIGTELAWLEALARDTGLLVPRVVRRTDGAPAAVVGGRVCVLLSWTRGRFLDDGLRPAHLQRVGGLLAALHEHTRTFPAPPGTRRVYGVDDASWWVPDQLGDRTLDRLAGHAQETYGEDAGEVSRAMLTRIREVAAGLGEGPDEFGLIHGDLHQENFLFAPGGAAAAIDFDDCGLGHHAYDLAVPLAELRHRDDLPALRTALLAGYREVRPLSAPAEAAIDTFMELKRVQLMFWIMDRRLGDAADWWRESVGNDLAAIRAVLG